MSANQKTVAILEIGTTDLTIKSRREDESPSGWAVIAFTPSCSLRCQKIHRHEHLELFAKAICAACGSSDPVFIEQVEDAILDITIDPPQ